MENLGLPEPLWSHLDGRLWHATDCNGLCGIITDGEIKVACGDQSVGSFCRNQGGVSLFDFGPASENVENQFHNWCGWFGHQQDARVSVWLEIERSSVRQNLADAKEAREALSRFMDKRRVEGKIHEPGIQLVPGVEACHSGPVPLAVIVGVLVVDQHDWSLIRVLGKPDESTIREIAEFESTLPPYKEDPLVLALQEARQRALNREPDVDEVGEVGNDNE